MPTKESFTGQLVLFDVVCNLVVSYGARLECGSFHIIELWDKVVANKDSLQVVIDRYQYNAVLDRRYQQDLFARDLGYQLLIQNAAFDPNDANKYITPLKCAPWVEQGHNLCLFSDSFDDSQTTMQLASVADVGYAYEPLNGEGQGIENNFVKKQ